ncbi:hypothetical protein HMPREF9946_04973 [Acetobacteraceae bacterium AT-5844]|nr:hypothetical protein HMPREF9946_04973 [Acetobacteraceae bacterium AT-5844]
MTARERNFPGTLSFLSSNFQAPSATPIQSPRAAPVLGAGVPNKTQLTKGRRGGPGGE